MAEDTCLKKLTQSRGYASSGEDRDQTTEAKTIFYENLSTPDLTELSFTVDYNQIFTIKLFMRKSKKNMKGEEKETNCHVKLKN